MTDGYRNFMNTAIRMKSFRLLSIAIPVIFFFLGFKIIAPHINFELMPAEDTNQLTYSIEATTGTNTDAMNTLVGDISQIFT